MSDLIDNASAPKEATVETETTQVESQQPQQTAEVPETKPSVQEAQERMVPISTVQKERRERQELQRKLAEFEQKSKLNQYDENDMSAIMAHPFVQELLIKQAKSELTDYAKGRLEEYPQIPDAVKRAMLKNVRGFVKETTTDVDSAKVDIDEYIDELLGELQVAPVQQPKVIPVMSTKPQESATGAKPLEVQEILEKPVDEWSEDEAKLVDNYKKSMPKR